MPDFTARAPGGSQPLSIGLVGPPGGGKTLSALRIAKGMQSVRGGDIIVIDTEGKRAAKYNETIPFLYVDFRSSYRSAMFLEAIMAQVPRKPAAIIIDSMSDEHEGIGGYLEYHDEMVPKMGNNEWAAWAKPKAERKRLITGLLHIDIPIIFTFRAREKTKQIKNEKGKMAVENIGWMPVAPLEIVHALDLTCLLPPRADGVPVWKSDKVGEDFIVKLPIFLQPFITEGDTLSEKHGAAFAKWASNSGSPASPPAVGERETGPEALREAPPPVLSTLLEEIDMALAAAALVGTHELQAEWKALHVSHQAALKERLDTVHKPNAIRADSDT